MCLTANNEAVLLPVVRAVDGHHFLMYIHTFAEHTESFLLQWCGAYCVAEYLVSLRYSAQVSHSTWDDSSAVYLDVQMFYIDWILNCLKLHPILPEETTCCIGSNVTLPLKSFFLFNRELWLYCVTGFLMERCITIMVICSVTPCSQVHGYQHFRGTLPSDYMGSYPRRLVFMSRFLRNTNVGVPMGWRKYYSIM
jgi:hypothetical protein